MTVSFQTQPWFFEKVLFSLFALVWTALFLSITLNQTLTLQLTLLALLLVTGLLSFQRIFKESIQLKRTINCMAIQFQDINNGNSEQLELEHFPDSLNSLLKEIQLHLSMETDRLLQEQSFSSDASHELRTPLAGMRLQAQIAQRVKDDTKRDKALDNIIKAVDRSTRMVEQLLNFSRLTRRRSQAEQSKVNLTELCRQIIAKYGSKIEEKQLQLDVIVHEHREKIVNANKDQISALFANSIQNAIEHSPKNGELRVSLDSISLEGREEFFFTVEDSGSGIVETDKQRVIVPFQRSSDGQQKGTGLGLAICTRIAQLHDGHIELLDSELGGLKLKIKFLCSV